MAPLRGTPDPWGAGRIRSHALRGGGNNGPCERGKRRRAVRLLIEVYRRSDRSGGCGVGVRLKTGGAELGCAADALLGKAWRSNLVGQLLILLVTEPSVICFEG